MQTGLQMSNCVTIFAVGKSPYLDLVPKRQLLSLFCVQIDLTGNEGVLIVKRRNAIISIATKTFKKHNGVSSFFFFILVSFKEVIWHGIYWVTKEIRLG